MITSVLQPLFGGLLIGTSATVLMAVNGRIAGLTGIVSGLVPPEIQPDWPWRATFVAGMLGSPFIYDALFKQSPPFLPQASLELTVVAGLLVGIGASFSSGCTSGHGVCGLARLSVRSVAAVATFMLFAALTVFLTHHLLER